MFLLDSTILTKHLLKKLLGNFQPYLFGDLKQMPWKLYWVNRRETWRESLHLRWTYWSNWIESLKSATNLRTCAKGVHSFFISLSLIFDSEQKYIFNLFLSDNYEHPIPLGFERPELNSSPLTSHTKTHSFYHTHTQTHTHTHTHTHTSYYQERQNNYYVSCIKYFL